MAAKKNTTHATPRQTRKVHKRKLAENLPTETSTSADSILTEAVPTPADPTIVAASARMGKRHRHLNRHRQAHALHSSLLRPSISLASVSAPRAGR